MAIQPLLWPALALCLSFITILVLHPSRKDTVLQRLGYARTATSASPSEEKKPHSKSTTLELASTFPPSQRGQLKKLPPAQVKSLGDLTFDQKTFERSQLGFEEDYETADDSKYVYSGFSVREIKALGDFPDYALLSDVPPPRPYANFDIDRARARPYRPFRWPYHQTMSLSKLEPDWWIELEQTYKERIAQRKALHAQHGAGVLQYLPGTSLACKELMEMVLQFLCARYPHYFSLSPCQRILTNKILGVEADIREKHPLLVLLDHVPEDFAVVLRDPASGQYVFRAGVLCSALGWNVQSKIGLKLHEIHEPIPDYKEKMQFSMDRYFAKLPTSKPIQRGSWGLEVDQPLYMPPDDPHTHHRSRQDPSLPLSRVHLRVDWQTLRRLPLSGGIVFNFKALFTPVAEFRDEPYIPGLLLRVLRHGSEDIMRYKSTWHTEHVVVPALDMFAKEQGVNGMVKEFGDEGWEGPGTLEESPWFPGWEAKWRSQQGF